MHDISANIPYVPPKTNQGKVWWMNEQNLLLSFFLVDFNLENVTFGRAILFSISSYFMNLDVIPEEKVTSISSSDKLLYLNEFIASCFNSGKTSPQAMNTSYQSTVKESYPNVPARGSSFKTVSSMKSQVNAIFSQILSNLWTRRLKTLKNINCKPGSSAPRTIGTPARR